jgi:hypothetical protein
MGKDVRFYLKRRHGLYLVKSNFGTRRYFMTLIEALKYIEARRATAQKYKLWGYS